MNNDKKVLLYALLVVCLVMVIGTLSTFAFFKRSFSDGTKKTVTNASTTNLDVDFSTSEYINNISGVLIDEDDYLDEADSTKFTIKKPSTSTIASDIYYDILLTDISISDNLKSSYFVWKLVKGTDTVVASGNFSTIGKNTSITLSTKTKISGTHSYSLYVYLKNDDSVNQLNLLNGSFTAKVAVDAYIGKA